MLGAGGFGITYLALDHRLKQAVALKEFFPQRLATRGDDGTTLRARTPRGEKYFHQARDAFLAEARALAQFRHPSIVRVSRHLEEFGTAYIAMDYERGETLHITLRRNGAMDDEAARNLFRPLLDGLKLMHARNFIHGDIKPANVIIRGEGGPVLIDFGAVRGETRWSRQVSWHTYTPGYSPPEQQVDVQKSGPWSDIYSVGALLFHCITGRQPPAATERVFARYFGRPDPLDTVLDDMRDQIPVDHAPAVGAVVAAMSLEAGRRPANVDEFIAAWNGEWRPRAAAEVVPGARRLIDPESGRGTEVATPAYINISAEIRRLAQSHLAEHIDGAKAERLVATLHSTCTSTSDFYHRLGEHIASEVKREEFLAAVTLGEYLH